METLKLYKEESLKEAFEAGKKHGKETAFLSDVDTFNYDQWLLRHKGNSGYDVREKDFVAMQTNAQIGVINGYKPLTMDAIVDAVSDLTGMDKEIIYVHNPRDPAVLRNRQLVYYLCYHHVSNPIQEISKKIGKKHHSTLLHSVQKAKDYIEVDRHMRHNLELVYMMLKARGYNTEFFVYSPNVPYNRNVKRVYIEEAQIAN